MSSSRRRFLHIQTQATISVAVVLFFGLGFASIWAQGLAREDADTERLSNKIDIAVIKQQVATQDAALRTIPDQIQALHDTVLQMKDDSANLRKDFDDARGNIKWLVGLVLTLAIQRAGEWLWSLRSNGQRNRNAESSDCAPTVGRKEG